MENRGYKDTRMAKSGNIEERPTFGKWGGLYGITRRAKARAWAQGGAAGEGLGPQASPHPKSQNESGNTSAKKQYGGILFCYEFNFQ